MQQKKSLAQKVNIMRAAVMGANDGILSVAGIVIGVAGANASSYGVFISGIAAIVVMLIFSLIAKRSNRLKG